MVGVRRECRSVLYYNERTRGEEQRSVSHDETSLMVVTLPLMLRTCWDSVVVHSIKFVRKC